MTSDDSADEAVTVLQQLGLKEYEAKCFVGLTRVQTGTAKRLSEITDVPRTRVYDAIRVLEAQGLVEIQHTSPQQFRAVDVEEAMETLREQYETRVERLGDALQQAEEIQADEDDSLQEVWSLTGQSAIQQRTERLLSETDREVVLVIGDSSLLTPDLVEHLNDLDDDVDLLVGAVDESLREQVEDAVPDVQAFTSGLGWLRGAGVDDDLSIGRLLLIDRSTILVSTIHRDTGDEWAVFGGGFGNGLVVMARRLMAEGLVGRRDPEMND
jgi:sugar-specific transcriptional regulator TrmB